MGRRKKEIPRNGPRTFDVPLRYTTFENLNALLETEFYGSQPSAAAERIVHDWLLNALDKKLYSISWSIKDAKDAGYLPLSKHGRRRNYLLACEERKEKIRPVFKGLARYNLEFLPKIEHTNEIKNPFYQKKTEEIIEQILEQELPNHLAKSGIF